MHKQCQVPAYWMQQSEPDFICQPQSPNNNLSALRIKKTWNDMKVLEAISIVHLKWRSLRALTIFTQTQVYYSV